MSIKDSYYTVTEASKKLGVSRQTVSRWIASGKIVAESIGREKLIKKSQLKNIDVKFRIDTFGKNLKKALVAGMRKKHILSEKDKIELIEKADEGDDLQLKVIKENGEVEKLNIEIIFKDEKTGGGRLEFHIQRTNGKEV